MATFNFSNGFTRISGVSTTSSLNYSEGGVDFTLSIQNGDTSNAAFIGGGQISGFKSAGSNLASQDVIILDVVGTGETRFDGVIALNVAIASGSWTVNGVALNPGTVNLTGPQANLTFTLSSGTGFFTVNSLVADINCFLSGTRVATPDGCRAVEDLEPGDRVLTRTGETTVNWVGVQPIDTRLSNPAKVNPICIQARALGDNLPERDLFLSPDHAIEWDGYLINAGALVNGTTITQMAQMPIEGFTYYHIETDAHDLLLAEGLPAESFLDITNTQDFENWDARSTSTPIREMELPRISAERMLPEGLKQLLSDRAGALRPKAAA